MEPSCRYIDFLDISPFVRYAHHMPDANKDNHVIPWRYIYDYEFIYVVQGSMEVQTKPNPTPSKPTTSISCLPTSGTAG